MMVPGMNVLDAALRIINPQGVTLFKFAGNVGQSNGQDLPTYTNVGDIDGSVQPIDRGAYEFLGLDFNKKYVKLYTDWDIRDVERDGAGDVFVFGCEYYHAQGRGDWMQQDGWNVILAVMIPPLSEAQLV